MKHHSSVHLYSIKSIEKIYNQSQRIVEDLWRMRREGSREITGEAAGAHSELLERMGALSSHPPLDRKVFSSNSLSGVGALVKVDGELHPIIRQEVVDFQPVVPNYSALKEHNKSRAITPRDYFMNVVSHEYGHIFLGILDKRLKWYLPFAKMSSPVSQEADEGFAFWFGDIISGIDTPICSFALNYEMNSGLDSGKIVSTYHSLKEMESAKGINTVLEPKNLAQILF